MDVKKCYSDQELEEFRIIILKKLEIARARVKELTSDITGNENGTDDTFKSYSRDEGEINVASKVQERTKTIIFISKLEAALYRIEIKTYGICCITGQLILKQRLLAAPHTTCCIEAKPLKK